MTDQSETGAAALEQRRRWHELEAASQGRRVADQAEAAWRDSALEGRPHLTLACGHLSPTGNGPLAEAGYGYCDEHGVSRIATEAADA
jgi:hypothetical protein